MHTHTDATHAHTHTHTHACQHSATRIGKNQVEGFSLDMESSPLAGNELAEL